MPTILSPLITDAGLAAAIAASGAGLQLEITHVALGTGQYTPAAAQTALTNRKEKVTIGAGLVTAVGGFSISVLFPAWAGVPNPYNATEVGFYAGDPDAGGVLFAVFSHPSAVIVQRNALDYVASFGLQLTRVPAGSVTVVVDPDGPVSLALMNAHLLAANPHPQYVRNDAAQGLTAGQKEQARDNINAPPGGNIKTVNAANTPVTLTIEDAGLVLLDASAGSVVVNLPLSNASAQPVEFKFCRIDSTSANTATVNRAGADTIDGATSKVLTANYDHRSIVSDGGTAWVTTSLKVNGASGAQCYLDKSALNLVLSRFNGIYVPINGVMQEIPAIGVTIAPTDLAAATLYYIYLYMAAGVMTGEVSATAPVLDAATSVMIKTGDATRTLVGAWKTAGAAVWSTIPTEGSSWFNRREKSYTAALSATRTTSSGTPAEIHSEIRAPFFMWDGEMPHVITTGITSNTSGGVNAFSQVSWNGGTPEVNGVRANTPTNTRVSFAISTRTRAAGILAQGLHYATLFISSDPGQTSTWETGAITGTSLTVTTKG